MACCSVVCGVESGVWCLLTPPPVPQGISANTEDLLKNMDVIGEAHAKGLVVFCWGDDNNNHENRRTLREHDIDGLIYDR